MLPALPAEAGGLPRNQRESAIGKLVKDDPLQARKKMVHDERLHLVARRRALDMAKRDYFSHTDPDGIGPNKVARLAGYRLPYFYSKKRDANNIESVAAGQETAQDAYDAWIKSSAHRSHLRGEGFFKSQTRYGVGYAFREGTKFRHYYVFVTAPPEPGGPRPLSMAKIKRFLRLTPQQLESAP